MQQDKTYIGLIIALTSIFAASLIFQNSTLQDIKWFALFAAAVLAAWKFLRHTKFSKKLQNYAEKNNATSDANYSIKECENIAKNWAKDSFDHINTGEELSFAWNRATSDIAPVYHFQSGEFIQARYFYTNYGPKNKPIYIFVDATNGSVISPKPDDKVDSTEPFESLEGYKLTKKMLPRLVSAQMRDDDNGIIEDFNIEVGGKSKNANNSSGE